MPETVKRRYFSKLFGNVGSGAFVLASQALLSRCLGPMQFGVLTFVQAHFEAVFTDLNISTAFFTKISQDRRTYSSSAAFFLLVVGLVTTVVLIYLSAVFLIGRNAFVWPQAPPLVVWLGFFLGLTIYVSRNSTLITDASGHAQKVETLRLIRGAGTLVIIAILYCVKLISIPTVMLAMIASNIAFILVCIPYGHRQMGAGKLDFSRASLLNSARSYREYSTLLVSYSIVSLVLSIFERWFLQYAAGPKEQAYFGIASQLSNAILLSTAALTFIFHRECAVAFAENNQTELKRLFQVYVRRIFVVVAIPCIFMAFHSKEIFLLFSGSKYAEGWVTLAIMAFYPISQGAGQLSVVLQLASNQTKLYTLLGMARDSVGLFVDYFLIAPRDWVVPGLQLGATGIAIKSLLSMLVTAYSVHYANCRNLKVSFSRQVRYEVLTLLILAGCTGACKMVTLLSISTQAMLLKLFASGGLYAGILILLLLRVPTLFGVTREELISCLKPVLRTFPKFRPYVMKDSVYK